MEITGKITTVELWTATTELRWIKRKVEIIQGFGEIQTILQQKYVDMDRYGFPEKHEWRDVPVVEE